MHHTVLLTTSGTGSRLKQLTATKNKVLVEVGGKTMLSYLLNSYPADTEFIVTVGYQAKQVKAAFAAQHPDSTVMFVEVNPYEGLGSSLGYSMLQAKQYLQKSFIFHACDTLVREPIPLPEFNWCGGYPGSSTEQYASFTVDGRTISTIHEKGAQQWDYVHIGLVGILDYEEFWTQLQAAYDENSNDSTLNDVTAINRMIAAGTSFQAQEFTSWLDIGNLDTWQQADKQLSSTM